MSLFSIKNLLIIKFVVILIYLPTLSWAAVYKYRMGFDTRYGTHYYGAPTTATHRHTFDYEQSSEFNSKWSAITGVRTEVESAYASVPDRYGTSDVGKYDSQTFLLRDNYLQFQDGIFRTRVGFQQVVWGEAFGYYYADIVNPKDYREAGLGDLSRNRLTSPMANLQWILSDSSIQVLYIPKAGYNLLPRPGSDFNSFKLTGPLAASSIQVKRDPKEDVTKGEYGIRLNKEIARVDLSVFHLNYTDRMPVYTLTMVPLELTPTYKPLQTTGITATYDLNGYLLRTEILNHSDRELNTLEGTTFSSAKSDEFVHVFGVDLQPMDKWNVALQYSESRLSKKSWVNRPSIETILSARIAKTFGNDSGFETLLTSFTSDSSTLVQANYRVPISNNAEVLFGLDKFDGKETSALGRFREASRAWVMVKASFTKK